MLNESLPSTSTPVIPVTPNTSLPDVETTSAETTDVGDEPSVPAPDHGSTNEQLTEWQLAQAIRRKFELAHKRYQEHVYDARDCGVLLEEAYQRFGGYGKKPEWKAWLVRNCDIHFQTAERYRRLARRWPEIEAEQKRSGDTSLTMRKAQEILSLIDGMDEGSENNGGTGNRKRKTKTTKKAFYTQAFRIETKHQEEFEILYRALQLRFGTDNFTDTVVSAFAWIVKKGDEGQS